MLPLLCCRISKRPGSIPSCLKNSFARFSFDTKRNEFETEKFPIFSGHTKRCDATEVRTRKKGTVATTFNFLELRAQASLHILSFKVWNIELELQSMKHRAGSLWGVSLSRFWALTESKVEQVRASLMPNLLDNRKALPTGPISPFWWAFIKFTLS